MAPQLSPGNRLANTAFTRILVGFVLCAVVYGVSKVLLQKFLAPLPGNELLGNTLSESIGCIVIIATYVWLYSRYERRRITELSLRKFGRQALLGTLLGAGLLSLVVACIYMLGHVQVVAVNPVSSVITYFIISLNAGVVEEILFRGILFRITEEKLGSYGALAISSVLFGSIHLMNENSSLLAGTAVALEAGLLLGASYMLTRNLWFPIFVHFSWNFAESGIFGTAMSGHAPEHSLLTTSIQGNELLTGGSFGPEASLPAIIICTTAAIILLYKCRRNGNIILPHKETKTAIPGS